ncbi:HTTM domain-containing protein [Streptomyces oceani]|uniref:HTTM domain-containing protein n=1 Tax=Streptomyces oceani TaxID=1075402 RepID=UPI0014815403|nr:HTTM domain-containing protein [Streptomyces oceani]
MAAWRPRLEESANRGFARVTGAALGPYQSAVVRIGFAATWLFFLLREVPHRHELYGPDSPWGWDLAQRLVDSNGSFTVLLWTESDLWFELVYVLAVLSSAALLLGWRTRTMSVLFMVGVLSLQNRSVFMGDGGDNIIHLIAIYLVLTRCGRVWSLDARRESRQSDTGAGARDTTGVVLWALSGMTLLVVTLGPGLSAGWAVVFWGLWVVHALWWKVNRNHSEPRQLCDIIANLVHNGALLVIMIEVCLVYATAGWYKIQGSRWQDGTAVFYPMKLDYFAPWPELNDVLASNGLAIMLMTYGTVFVQVAFPFALLNRRAKNVLLVIMIVEHLSIAVLLGLPFFSLAMVAADAVFLPTAALLWMGARASGLRGRLTRDRRPDGDGSARTAEAEAEPEGPEKAGPRTRSASVGKQRQPAESETTDSSSPGSPVR